MGVVTTRQLKTKKVASFFEGKNRGDTAGCCPGWHQP